MELYDGPLNAEEILSRWYKTAAERSYGAYIPFVGIVRDDDGIEALSFDIYKPLLKRWFDKWQKRAAERGAVVLMAHSVGDVAVGRSSYISAVLSPHRREALELIDEFVEDFKANAPIWKYDIRNGERIYAGERSTPMDGAGILSYKGEG